jgi:hypothetical protein
MIHKTIRCLLLALVGLFATNSSAQQQRPANSLVGTYATGHRFGGSALTLEADGSYVEKSSDCTMDYVESGTYIYVSEVLHFKIVKYIAKSHGSEREIDLLDRNGRKEAFSIYAGEISTEFKLRPIRWSDRMYLIYENELNSFANAVNFGLEPRSELGSDPYYGSFYLREGDQKKKVSGAPRMPDKWRSVLLRRPVAATVVELKGDGKGTLATINKGSKSGLRVGMRLLTQDEDPSPWSVIEIVSVTDKSAVIRTYGGIAVGDKLATKYVSRIYRL